MAALGEVDDRESTMRQPERIVGQVQGALIVGTAMSDGIVHSIEKRRFEGTLKS
jgi:uncharacterized membrane protein